jgi:predicted nucleic acid-binding protein
VRPSSYSDYIVTGDRDLLSFKRYEQINIVSASALLKMLRRILGI